MIDIDLNKQLQELLSSTDELLIQNKRSDKPIVVAWGLLNAGKSYLLNMLTDHIDKEFFKTNDFRETTEIKSLETDHFIYLDTPGLDANALDDTQAMKGANEADIILFVHQLQGALEAIEIEFLKSLKYSFGTFAEKNIILVLSKTDKESPEKVEQIEKSILAQCHQHLDFTPKCFKISGKRYKTGIQNHKEPLIHSAHIKDLFEHINRMAESSNVRNQRTLQMVNDLLVRYDALEEKFIDVHFKVRKDINNEFLSFNQSIKSLERFLNDSSEKWTEIS